LYYSTGNSNVYKWRGRKCVEDALFAISTIATISLEEKLLGQAKKIK
jgi:hypothetical protein